MDNSKKYFFSDFTLDHYKQILILLKQDHEFVHYADFDEGKKFVLKRHDVDFSIESARKMAILESELGVKSTYFFMLHSEFYNLLEHESIQTVKEIHSLGHDIGLHFDAQFYNITNQEDLDSRIIFEKQIIEYYLSVKIKVFSFHNTTNFTMNCKKWIYGGLINTYAQNFQTNLGYCSDSNGYWRFQRMYDYIDENKHKSLQILTHPLWWTDKIKSPKQKIYDNIETRANNVKKMYNETLKSFNRKNIDW